jgi:hypothetical protein
MIAYKICNILLIKIYNILLIKNYKSLTIFVNQFNYQHKYIIFIIKFVIYCNNKCYEFKIHNMYNNYIN